MASYNRIILVGNLTRDPDYKQLASGQGVCRLSLATNRQFKNRQSDALVQEVCYIDIDVWGAQADSCRQYLQKGRQILIEGRLKYDTWQDQAGQTRSKHSVVADRVTFLSNQAGNLDSDDVSKDVSESETDSFQLNSNNPVERDLMNQLEKAKAKMQAAKKESTPQPAASVSKPAAHNEFVDQPPFTDDLPF
jgi:single-strand DNA-binding protein